MTRINDQVMGEIAAELDNSDQIQSGALGKNLQAVLNADEFRRRYVQIEEVGVPDAIADTFVIIRIRTGFRYRVDRVAWNNQQAGAAANLLMVIERTDPAVANFRNVIGNAVLPAATFQAVVGDMFVMATASVDEQRPGPFIVPALAELRFDLTKFGGGILEAGAQILTLFGERLPPERDWERTRADTVLVG